MLPRGINNFLRKFYTETEEEMEDLIAKLKGQVIEQLNLEDINPEDIDSWS